MKKTSSYRKGLCAAVVTLFMAAAGTASVTAAEVTVTAEFRPNALFPDRNEFTNTTKLSEYCTWAAAHCASQDLYMFDVPLSSWYKTYTPRSTARKKFYVRFPSPRTEQIINEATGAVQQINISFESVAAQTRPGSRANPTFTSYPKGCSHVKSTRNGAFVRFGWRIPSPKNPPACYSDAQEIPREPLAITMDWLGLGIKITSPSPLSLEAGVYKGRAVLTAGGSEADIDFGDDVSSEDIVLNFLFTVVHDFRVVFSGSRLSVNLAPVGGWQQWTAYGRAPSRLQQELPFTLTSSNDFSVKMRCEHEVAGRCGIEDLSAGTVVPVDVDVTMPGMSVQGSGTPALNTALVSEASGITAPRFSPDAYLVSRPSKLTFSANGAAVTQMLKAPGSRWQGDVTVVFDSDP